MKQKKTIIAIIGIVIISIISFGALQQQKNKTETIKQEERKEVKSDIKKNDKNPFKSLSKANANTLDKLDRVVDKIITKKENFKPLDGLKEAEEILKALDVKDADLQTVHEAYTGVIETVKDPNVENLKAARTSMANMEDAEISDYMTNSYSDKLVGIVAQAKLQDREDIEKQTKPLTPQQVQAKKDAKVKADKAAAEKAKADKVEQDKQQAESKAKQDAQRETDRVAAEQAAQGSGDDISGTDAPNGNVMEEGGYVSPASPVNNGDGGVSSNNDAQNTANNTPTPPPSQGNDISGTDAPNGGVMEPGGW